MTQTAKKWLAPIIPAVVAFVLAFTQPFYAVDAFICDALYGQLRTPSEKIIIVGVDEDTLDEYGSFATWSRMKSINLLDILYAESKNAPMAVGFDFIFQGETSPQIDADLATAASKGNVVVAGNLVYDGQTEEGEDGTKSYNAWNISGVEHSYKALDKVVDTGFADAFVSKDGVIRSTMISAEVGDERIPSFAFAMYEKYMEATGQSVVIPYTDGNICQFFYASKSCEYQMVALNDVLDGNVPASEFAGKLVLVGAYASGMQDSYVAASDRGSNMFGVEVNANIIQALMDGKTALPATT